MVGTLASHTLRSLVANELGEPKEKLPPDEHTALESAVRRKLDRRLLPLCTGWFLLSIVDKNNVASAHVVGLQQSLKISNYQYSIALTMTLVFYLAAQFPSTLLLKYIGPDIILPTMVILWGIISALQGNQGFVVNFSGLMACRIFLGVAEGGVFPGIVLYLSLFYPRMKLQSRIAAFFATTNLCSTFSGLLAAAIDQMNELGGKPGWAWIFIMEGSFAVIFGVLSLFLSPRSPEKARFLTEKERMCVVSALKHAGSIPEDDRMDNFSWSEVIKSAKSPHVWLLVVTSFCSGAMLYGLALFEPTIVSSLGYKGNQALLMSVPPTAAAFVWCVVSGTISDHYQCRGYTLIVLCLVQLTGFVMFHASKSNHVRYASLFIIIPGVHSVVPTLNAWASNNSAPHTRRAMVVAAVSVTAQTGGILSTWLLGYISPGPNYTSAMITFISMSGGMIVLSIVNLACLWRENGLKAKQREQLRKEDEPAGLGDRSAWFIYSL